MAMQSLIWVENIDGVIYQEDLIPKEVLKAGDKIRAIVKEVNEHNRGPQVILTRADKDMLDKLFFIEVPEISEGRIEVVNSVRIPGVRSKIAVRSLDPRVMAYGACIGLRGSRVQAVQNDLSGERIDVIEYDDDQANYVKKALSPVEVKMIAIDESNKMMDIAVEQESLAQAIGKGGQNVRMASELTGWDLNVFSEQDFQKKQQKENERYKNLFMENLDIDETIAEILVINGIVSLDVLLATDDGVLANIESFDADLIEQLKVRAQDAVLIRELSSEKPDDDLVNLKGVSEFLVYKLVEKGIVSRDDLADLSADELRDIDPDLSELQASKIILSAREHWFENDS